MDIHRETYKQEARELLVELESSLLELEERPDDKDLIGGVFRAMHTIKGSGAMFGFDDVAAFTHQVESVFELVREGKIRVAKELVDLTLSACDQIRKMVDGEPVEEAEVREITDLFIGMIPVADPSHKVAPPDLADAPSRREQKDATFSIRFTPDQEILSSGANPLLLLNELRDLGECRVIALIKDVPPLKDLNACACCFSWHIVLTTKRDMNAVKDVFIFVEDECELDIKLIDEEDVEGVEGHKKLGEILVERGDLKREALQETLASQKRVGELLVEAQAVDPGAVDAALLEQHHIEDKRRQRREKAAALSIRVAAEKLDTLVDLVGELVTVQASLTQTAGLKDDAELLSIAEEVERLTSDLRDNTMSIRMLPIGTTFSKFKRLVRDLSGDLGKEVALTTEGEETELDKTVIERLNDPMVHIIRNSIDHGVESPEIRESLGKPKQGTIHLSAIHSGANVLIRIADDGAGLDPELIRAKAVENGLISSDAEMTEREILLLILAPGFSTAGKITDVSGRGVGMDVVKRSIEALRGAIDIVSEKGRGATITLKLPLTLAIIDGLLVKIGEDYYVLPLSTVEECVELTRENMARARGRNMINVRGEIVPYILLRKLFRIDGAPPMIQHIVIAGVDGHRIGFVVDNVLGEHQTVIKTLSRVYKDAAEFSGATILADGTVALILDVQKMTNTAVMEECSFQGERINRGAE